MVPIILAIRLLAASQVLLFSLAFGFSNNPPRIRILGFALSLGAISYLILPWVELNAGVGFLAVLVLSSQTIPLLLFLFVWVVFEDDRKLPSALLFAALLYLAFSLWVGRQLLVGDSEQPLIGLGVQLAKLAWALSAVFVIWHGTLYDLVEARYRLRKIFATSLGCIVAVVVIAELVSAGQVPGFIELIGMSLIMVVTTCMNVAFMKINPAFILVRSSSKPRPSTMGNHRVLNLQQLMESERCYAEHGLRIADVALKMNVPEYQLRRLINSEMGYRNFNQFVNRYRITEATARLISEQQLPVLTIALDVGFRSISSFNEAFRLQHSCSPTDYRSRNLDEK